MMANFPASTAIRPRPVWARYLARQRGEAVVAKLSEEERRDVIAVLWGGPDDDALYVEAERLFLTYGI